MTISDTIAQIEALEKKATPGPWESVETQTGLFADIRAKDGWVAGEPINENAACIVKDANLIVALRNAAPSLITYIRALEKIVVDIINGMEFDKEEYEYRASMRLIADAEDALAAAREAGK